MKKWQCIVCGLIYNEADGWPDDGIAPGTRWEDVPAGEAPRWAPMGVSSGGNSPVASAVVAHDIPSNRQQETGAIDDRKKPRVRVVITLNLLLCLSESEQMHAPPIALQTHDGAGGRVNLYGGSDSLLLSINGY